MIFLTITLFANLSFATPPVKVVKDKNLSTDIKFSGSMVSGRYQVASEAVATVEDEKIIHDILKPRQNFKDRLQKSLEER